MPLVGCWTPSGESREVEDLAKFEIWRRAEDRAQLPEVHPFVVVFPEIVNRVVEIESIDEGDHPHGADPRKKEPVDPVAHGQPQGRTLRDEFSQMLTS